MGRLITYIKMTIWILKTGNFQCNMARGTSLQLGSYPPSVSSNEEELKKCCCLHQFTLDSNRNQYSTIKFMAKLSDKKINFLHTTIFKGK